jgi:hypothetical protein
MLRAGQRGVQIPGLDLAGIMGDPGDRPARRVRAVIGPPGRGLQPKQRRQPGERAGGWPLGTQDRWHAQRLPPFRGP